jgi:hypothetical protein
MGFIYIWAMNKFLFSVGLLFPFFIQAQSNIPCSSFCVTEVTLDSTNEVWNVNVDFAGTTNDFINYPYVAWMINATGDSVATGQLEYFGQIGGTSQIYHPNVLSDDFTEGQIYFVYDQDTCVLDFPCATAGVAYTSKWDMAVVVLAEGWQWNCAEMITDIVLYNAVGARIGNWASTNFIPFQGMPAGTYFYAATVGQRKLSGKLIRP